MGEGEGKRDEREGRGGEGEGEGKEEERGGRGGGERIRYK